MSRPTFADPVWGWGAITARVCHRTSFLGLQTDAFRRRAMRAIEEKRPDPPPIQWWDGKPVAEGPDLDAWADRRWGLREE